MKKVTICTLLLILSTTSFSQQTNQAPTVSKQDYLKKSKRQKTAAWILLSGGTLTTLLGTVESNPNSIAGGDNSRRTIFLITGLAAIGASIPLFIASSKNKKKAASFSLNFETAPVLQQSQFIYHSFPAATFTISIN